MASAGCNHACLLERTQAWSVPLTLESASRYHNQSGVEIRTVDFGGVGGIAALDPALPQVPERVNFLAPQSELFSACSRLA